MIIIIASFLTCVLMSILEYRRDKDSEVLAFSFFFGFIVALFFGLVAGILTSTNYNEYYAYTPTEITLSTIDNKSIALDGAKIYYIADDRIQQIDTGHAYIKHSDTPHAIYYKYCGYNRENWFRWLYTFPDGADYVEFYIPDGSISTTYHFGGK